jgi:ABC-type multidrug transport system ATPase subunit
MSFDDDDDDDFDLNEFKSFRKTNEFSSDDDDDDDAEAPLPPLTSSPIDDEFAQKESSITKEKKELSAFSKRLRKRAALGLEWHDLSLWLPQRKGKIKRILRDVTAECPGGELLAIMGASGAGKTSLLNVLAMRVTGEVRGTVRINGKRFTARQFRRISSYVEQDDRLFPWLTVRETLSYVSRLRLPSSTKRAEKDRLVEDIISELGLVKCADTIVGNAIVRGISGGERKRLAIGCELVVDPSILFLDEPTSGLDASAALHVVETLRVLARAGRTVICTIHQPRSGIYSLFDKLLLLAGEGETAYFGRAADAVPYFAALGHQCPSFTNPADFFLDITAINSHSKELIVESKARIAALTDAFAESRAPTAAPPPSDTASQLEVTLMPGSGFFTQLDVLTRRTARNLYRDKGRTVARFMTAIIVGALFGFIFFQRGYTLEDIQNRTGILFLICTNQAFGGLFAVLTTFVEEREIFLKERSLGYYGVLPYFLAKSIAEFPTSLSPLLFGVVLYWTVGLNPDLDRFGIFLAFVFLTSFVSESLGLFIAALVKSAAIANAISPLVLVFFLILSGLYLNNETIPAWISWLRYVSFIQWGYHGMMLNEFRGVEFTGTQMLPNGTSVMVVQTGEQVLDQLAMSDEVTVLDDILILIGMSLIYRLFAYLVLRFLRRGPRLGEVRKASESEVAMLKAADDALKKDA